MIIRPHNHHCNGAYLFRQPAYARFDAPACCAGVSYPEYDAPVMRLPSIQTKSIEAIADTLRAEWRASLFNAVAAARELGMSGPAVSESNLAWAVAWHIKKALSADGAFAQLLTSMSSLEELHAKLSRSLSSHDRQSWPLRELATSVACEARLDRHAPEVQDDAERHNSGAHMSFESLYKHHAPAVKRFCEAKHFREPECLADEAWSAVFASYWSSSSTTRWSGLCQVSTLVMTAARRIAWKSNPRQFVKPIHENTLIQMLDIDDIDKFDLWDAYRACRDELPARQRLCIELLLQHDVSRAAIAEILGCGRPNVTQLIERAMPQLRECLEQKGFGHGRRTVP